MTALKAYVSVEDYLEGERDSQIRHEYGAGEVYAMAGASDRHGLLAGALFAQMYPQSRQKRCQLFTADMKVRIDDHNDSYFYYPDLLLSCDPNDRESAYYRRKPCLLVEIVSPSSFRIDRHEKRFAYRMLPSLCEYLLVHQNVQEIEIFRYPEGTYTRYTTGRFRLDCLDITLSVEDIYADVENLNG